MFEKNSKLLAAGALP